MDPLIANELLSFQVAHVLQLDESLKGSNCILDASDTGTGKTYCAIALCKIKKLFAIQAYFLFHLRLPL